MEEEEINLNKVFNNDDDLKHYYHANLLEGTQCRCSKGSERGGSTLLSSKEVILVTKSQSTFPKASTKQARAWREEDLWTRGYGTILTQANTPSTSTHNPSETCGSRAANQADVLTKQGRSRLLDAICKNKANQMANKFCCNASNIMCRQ